MIFRYHIMVIGYIMIFLEWCLKSDSKYSDDSYGWLIKLMLLLLDSETMVIQSYELIISFNSQLTIDSYYPVVHNYTRGRCIFYV